MPKKFQFVIPLIGLSFLFLAIQFIWSDTTEDGQLRTISSDGIGYYSYLTNIFIEKNFTDQTADGRYFLENGSGVVNQYYPGTAVLMAPFMGLGYLAAGEDLKKGYANAFQISISIAALFYFVWGLFWFNRLLICFDFSPSVRTLSLLLISFGTHLMNYVITEPSMSHVYSWFAVTGFLLFIKKFSLDFQKKNLLIASLLLGIVVLIRPINGLVVFSIPFLLGSYESLTNTLSQAFKRSFILPSAIICISIILVQPLLVFIQSGSIGLWTYSGSGFYFQNPAIFEFLFSYRKGMFLYTPLLAVSFLSALFWLKKDRFKFFSFAIFMAFLIYMFSAWFNWYYGPSFSQRPFVEFLSLALIPLSYALSQILKSKWSLVPAILLSGIVALNLIQTYQYRAGIMSRWDMTKEKYWYIFLHTDEEYEGTIGGCNDLPPYQAEMNLIFSSLCTMDNSEENCSCAFKNSIDEESTFLADYTGHEFNLLTETKTDKRFLSKRGLFAKISIDSYELDTSACSESYLVIDFLDTAGKSYNYEAIRINEVPNNTPGKIRKWKYNVQLPPARSVNDMIKIYVWNPSKLDFFVDNLDIKLYRID